MLKHARVDRKTVFGIYDTKIMGAIDNFDKHIENYQPIYYFIDVNDVLESITSSGLIEFEFRNKRRMWEKNSPIFYFHMIEPVTVQSLITKK